MKKKTTYFLLKIKFTKLPQNGNANTICTIIENLFKSL